MQLAQPFCAVSAPYTVTYLDIDLWPTAWVLAMTGAMLLALRVFDHHATRAVTARTHEALQRALGDADPIRETD